MIKDNCVILNLDEYNAMRDLQEEQRKSLDELEKNYEYLADETTKEIDDLYRFIVFLNKNGYVFYREGTYAGEVHTLYQDTINEYGNVDLDKIKEIIVNEWNKEKLECDKSDNTAPDDLPFDVNF